MNVNRRESLLWVLEIVFPSVYYPPSLLEEPGKQDVLPTTWEELGRSYLRSLQSTHTLPPNRQGKGSRLTFSIYLSVPWVIQVTCKQTQVSDSKSFLYCRAPESCKDKFRREYRGRGSLFQSLILGMSIYKLTNCTPDSRAAGVPHHSTTKKPS